MVVSEDAFNSIQKAQILEAVAEADARLLDGADEFLQLFQVCSTAIKALA